jgi:predicted enzyme related to lactoylglutathione lyase
VTSPIQNKIGAVFIPVSEMSRAIKWYSRLLGFEIGSTSHEGKIFDVPMQGEVALILDGHKPVTNSSQPLCFFWTDDMEQARAHLIAQNVEIVRDIENIGSVSTLTLRDPDGNLIMLCRRNQ